MDIVTSAAIQHEEHIFHCHDFVCAPGKKNFTFFPFDWLLRNPFLGLLFSATQNFAILIQT